MILRIALKVKIGCLECGHTIHVDPKVKPVIYRARQIPFSKVSMVKAESDKMEANGIIEKVAQPTPWQSCMVVVEKRDVSTQICHDPKELNKAVMIEYHHMTNELVLKYFDVNKDILRRTDASEGSLGAVPLQQSQLVA